MHEVLKESLIRWAATRKDEVVFDPKRGYYSLDIVIDAFRKGQESGQNDYIEQARGKYYENARLAVEATNKMITKLNEKNIVPLKLYMNHSLTESIILLSIKEDLYIDDTFIDFAYPEATKIQTEYNINGKDFNIHINFIDEAEGFNHELLKSDGFGFSYDLVKGEELA